MFATLGAPDIEWMGAGEDLSPRTAPGQPCMNDVPGVSRAEDGDPCVHYENIEFGPCLHVVV